MTNILGTIVTGDTAAAAKADSIDGGSNVEENDDDDDEVQFVIVHKEIPLVDLSED